MGTIQTRFEAAASPDNQTSSKRTRFGALPMCVITAVACCLLGGCANSLPDTRTSALAAETPAEISARLQRHLKIEAAISGAPLLGGNRVMLLQNGPAAYQAMFAAMRSAKNSINLETFVFTDDEVGPIRGVVDRGAAPTARRLM